MVALQLFNLGLYFGIGSGTIFEESHNGLVGLLNELVECGRIVSEHILAGVHYRFVELCHFCVDLLALPDALENITEGLRQGVLVGIGAYGACGSDSFLQLVGQRLGEVGGIGSVHSIVVGYVVINDMLGSGNHVGQFGIKCLGDILAVHRAQVAQLGSTQEHIVATSDGTLEGHAHGQAVFNVHHNAVVPYAAAEHDGHARNVAGLVTQHDINLVGVGDGTQMALLVVAERLIDLLGHQLCALRLDVVHSVVGIDEAAAVVVGGRSGPVAQLGVGAHLELVESGLQVAESLIGIVGVAVAQQACIAVAVLSVAVLYALYGPAVEAVGQVGVSQLVGDFGTIAVTAGNSYVEEFLHVGRLLLDDVIVELALLDDIRIGTIGEELVLARLE